MTIQELKKKFERGDTPTSADFVALIDAFLGADLSNWPTTLPRSSAKNLTDIPFPAVLPASDGSQLTNLPVGEWVVVVDVPNYASAYSFVLPTDQTSIFTRTRRVRVTISGVYFYSEVGGSAYDSGADATTVTIGDAMPSNVLEAVAISAFNPWTSGGAVSPGMVGARGDFAPHATNPPSLMVQVESGNILSDGAFVNVPRALTAAVPVPAVFPRITRAVRDERTGALSLLHGSEAAIPLAPVLLPGLAPVARILCTPGMSAIEDSAIVDERALRAPSVRGYNLGIAEYYGKTKSVAAQDSFPANLAFSSDGTKMYVLGDFHDTVYQYTLATAWDVDTASYAGKSCSVAGQVSSAQGFAFSSDGTKMYVLDDTNNTVYQYTLATAWDVSTASYAAKSFSVAAQDTWPSGLAFSPDGTKMYVVGTQNKSAYQYTLATAWDVSTASYAAKSLSVTAQEGAPQELTFSSDGTKMYVVGSSTNAVYQYTLATAWDLSTATYAAKSLSVAPLEGVTRGLAFSADGTKMYVIGNAKATAYQYTSGFIT